MSRYICVWPCGTWCHPDELYQMNHLSDDFAYVAITEDASDEDCDMIADLEYLVAQCAD